MPASSLDHLLDAAADMPVAPIDHLVNAALNAPVLPTPALVYANMLKFAVTLQRRDPAKYSFRPVSEISHCGYKWSGYCVNIQQADKEPIKCVFTVKMEDPRFPLVLSLSARNFENEKTSDELLDFFESARQTTFPNVSTAYRMGAGTLGGLPIHDGIHVSAQWDVVNTETWDSYRSLMAIFIAHVIRDF